jgi:hypothetical protein
MLNTTFSANIRKKEKIGQDKISIVSLWPAMLSIAMFCYQYLKGF